MCIRDRCKTLFEQLNVTRANDNWNSRLFSGLELEWQQALNWLEQELLPENPQVESNLVESA